MNNPLDLDLNARCEVFATLEQANNESGSSIYQLAIGLAKRIALQIYTPAKYWLVLNTNSFAPPILLSIFRSRLRA